MKVKIIDLLNSIHIPRRGFLSKIAGNDFDMTLRDNGVVINVLGYPTSIVFVPLSNIRCLELFDEGTKGAQSQVAESAVAAEPKARRRKQVTEELEAPAA